MNFTAMSWEFVRNTDFNANNFFNNYNNVPRPAFHRNQFGFTLGGPIRQNRTFFFTDYEGTHAAQPVTSTSTIPTPAQEQMIETGNFARFLPPSTTPIHVDSRQHFAARGLYGKPDPIALSRSGCGADRIAAARADQLECGE